MNISNIISVDPAQKTLGYIHSEITGRLLRNSGIARNNEPSHSQYLLNLIFASASPGGWKYGICLLILRLFFAAIMIVSGSFILSGEINAPALPIPAEVYAISQIVIGGMLAFGFFSRFAMLAGFTGYAHIATCKIIAGIFSMSSLMLCMACLIFFILGTGRISIDFLIRTGIIRHIRRRRRRLAILRLSYRAYASMN